MAKTSVELKDKNGTVVELKDKNGTVITEGVQLHVWNDKPKDSHEWRDYEGTVVADESGVLNIRYEGYGQVIDTPVTGYAESMREIVKIKAKA